MAAGEPLAFAGGRDPGVARHPGAGVRRRVPGRTRIRLPGARALVIRLPGHAAAADDQRVNETWLPDELLHAGAEHLDAAFIAGFDRKQGYPDPEADLAAFAAHGL